MAVRFPGAGDATRCKLTEADGFTSGLKRGSRIRSQLKEENRWCSLSQAELLMGLLDAADSSARGGARIASRHKRVKLCDMYGSMNPHVRFVLRLESEVRFRLIQHKKERYSFVPDYAN